MKTKFKTLFLVANILLVLLTFAAYAAPLVSPEDNALLPIIGLGYPPLLLCNVLSIILWLSLKSRWALLSLLTLILGYSSCTSLVNLSVPDKADDNAYRIASFNANFSKPITQLASEDKTVAETAFRKYLGEHKDISVLCVQEDGKSSRAYLQSVLKFPYKHQVEGLSVSIYSKFPIVGEGIIHLKSTTANTCLWADIKFPNQKVRIYTAHLEANRFDGEVPEVIVEDAPEDMSNAVLWGIVKHHAQFSTVRVHQARLISKHVQSCPYPVIVCGDFNETPQSYVYTVMKGDLQDSFQAEGLGLASTFGEKIPALRIDHLLVDQEIEILDHDISKNQFSDHYMIIAKLAL